MYENNLITEVYQHLGTQENIRHRSIVVPKETVTELMTVQEADQINSYQDPMLPGYRPTLMDEVNNDATNIITVEGMIIMAGLIVSLVCLGAVAALKGTD